LSSRMRLFYNAERIQESGFRSQDSGVRSQESGVRSAERNILHSAFCTLHSALFLPLDDSRGSDLKHSALCTLHSALTFPAAVRLLAALRDGVQTTRSIDQFAATCVKLKLHP
ncbi:MAG: hypothetical protein FWH27_14310, partial [Planctomycetaceae bacterium]|nr:hypothetical protein [Planctomycetaceae bacterium]